MSSVHQASTDIMYFKSKYNVWCNKNDFGSKLPKAVKARKDARAAEDCSKQSSLDPHLQERHRDTFVPYSDTVFREAAIEWLIETDQVTVSLISCASPQMFQLQNAADTGSRPPILPENDQHRISRNQGHQYSQPQSYTQAYHRTL